MGLGARLALVFAAVAAATALLVGGASYFTTDRQVSVDIDDFLRERANQISEGVRRRPQGRGDGRGQGRLATIVAVGADSQVQILLEDGSIRGNTELLLPVDQIDVALAKNTGKSVLRDVEIDEANFRMITANLNGGGAVQVARSLDSSAGLLRDLRLRLGLVTVVMALVSAIVGWVVAQRTTRPLRALTSVVDDVAETQDFSLPVPTAGSDEVGRLGRGFNRMLNVLQQSEEQQRRLVQNAAHELRTPLTSVTANLDWLERAPDIDEETRIATLASVRREVGELNDVITEIIQLATDERKESVMEPTDLVQVVEETVALFIERTGREVSVQSVPTNAVVEADAIGRALANLLSNAGKYSPADGSIDVEVGPDGVFVNDCGPGIPEAEREAVFHRFYRRNEDRGMPGSGLGLSIVAGIVQQHDGTLHVSESPQGGARVGFTLPNRSI